MLESVVNAREPNMLRGSCCSRYGDLLFHPSWADRQIRLPAQRVGLTYRVVSMEQDKSVSLPAKGKYTAR